MKLRSKIFLLVGGLFFFVFVCVQAVQEHLTEERFATETASIKQEIERRSEKRSVRVAHFIHESLIEKIEKITALLESVDVQSSLNMQFLSPDKHHLKNSWFGMGELIYDNEWIDFAENVQGSVTGSLAVIDDIRNFTVAIADPSKNVTVSSLYSDDGQNEQCIAVPFFLESIAKTDMPLYYFHFTQAAFERFLEKITDVNTHISQPEYINAFIQAITARAKKTPLDRNDIVQKALDVSLPQVRLAQKGCALGVGALFGSSIFPIMKEINALPMAISYHGFSANEGVGVYIQDIVQDSPITHVGDVSEKDGRYSPIELFTDTKKRLFIGQSIEKKYDGELPIYVRLGVDAKAALSRVAQFTGCSVFLSFKDSIIAGFSEYGDVLDVEDDTSLSKIDHDALSGTYNHGEVTYYYQKVKPLKSPYLSLYLITPEKEEFALYTTIRDVSQKVVNKIFQQIVWATIIGSLVMLLALNSVARKVTKPISVLVKACASLLNNGAHSVTLPAKYHSLHDEVGQLYSSFHMMVEGMKEKETVTAALNKVVSPSIAKEILKGNVHLGGEEKIVTVLFADVRNFTSLTEKMKPHDVIVMLNTCMTKIAGVIEEHNGVIDKFVGDEVMALFGAPVGFDDASQKAVLCSIEMQKRLLAWNKERRENGDTPVEMGIGIHTGVVVAGNMGAESRLNYTVLGSNVNLSARLCQSAKGGEVLVSLETKEASGLPEETFINERSEVLKGFSKNVEVFSVKTKE